MSHSTSRPALLAASAVVIASLVGCSASTPEPTSSEAGEALTIGGSVVIHTPSDENCADPHQLAGRSLLTVGRAQVDSLLYLNSDGEIEPWLAESYEVSEDATTYTFTLRDDVTFSDGTPLTANSVKATLDAVKEMGPRARVAATWFTRHVETTVVDPRTVRVEFSSGNAAFLNQITTVTLGIMSEDSAALAPEELCTEGVIGTGPFVFASAPYIANAGFRLEVRDDYDWAPASLHQGRAYLDAIDVQIVGDSSARAQSVVSGAADIMYEVNLADLSILGDTPVDVRPNPGLSEGLWVNVAGGGVLTDPAVRRALQIAYDRATIMGATQTEQTPVATSALSQATPGYADMSEYMTFDLDGAIEVLEEAGWELGSDGIRVKDGQPLTVSLMYASNRYQGNLPMIQLIQAGYREAGIDMVLRPVPDADEAGFWSAGDYELRISAQTLPDPSVLDLAFRIQGDAELNRINDAATAAGDTAERFEYVREAQEYIIQNGLFIPGKELALPTAYNPALGGISFTGDSLLILFEVGRLG